MRNVNENMQREDICNIDNQPGPSQEVGHSRVCLLCGCSILRRRSDVILHSNPNQLQQEIVTVITHSIPLNQVRIVPLLLNNICL